MKSDEIDLTGYKECSSCQGYGSAAGPNIDAYKSKRAEEAAKLREELWETEQRAEALRADLEEARRHSVRPPPCPACRGWCREMPTEVLDRLERRAERGAL